MTLFSFSHCSYKQLVIAESSPGLDGHKLAASLCKVPSIGVTLIPDSNIYALMARVNKVRSVRDLWCLSVCKSHSVSNPRLVKCVYRQTPF
jgi:hypothetical protein